MIKKLIITILILLLLPSILMARVSIDQPENFLEEIIYLISSGPQLLKLLFVSLVISFVLFLLWLFSPLGISFIICILVNIFIKNKKINILTWILEILILCFSLFLILIALIFSYIQLFSQERFFTMLGILETGISIFILGLAAIIFQIKGIGSLR